MVAEKIRIRIKATGKIVETSRAEAERLIELGLANYVKKRVHSPSNKMVAEGDMKTK